jgi:hypothetical protein
MISGARLIVALEPISAIGLKYYCGYIGFYSPRTAVLWPQTCLLFQLMTRCRLLFLTILAIFATSVAYADDLYVGTSYNSGFSITETTAGVTSTVETSGGPEMTSILDGQSLAWMYCIGLFTDIPVGTNYNDTTVTTNGIVGGTTINNAGQIAWLLDTYAVAAEGSTTLQDALQVAIWSVEYNGDGIGTAAGEPIVKGLSGQTYYTAEQSDLTALGSNTAPVSSVLWINPKDGSSNVYQAQVAPLVSVPEANAPAELLITMIAGLALALGITRLRPRSLSTDS